MKLTARPTSWRGLVLILLGGATVVYAGIELAPKPAPLPRVAQAVTAADRRRSEPGEPGGAEARKAGAPDAKASPGTDDETPPIRELFRPLIGKAPQPAVGAPSGAPQLPPAETPPAGRTFQLQGRTDLASGGGPRASDFQMMGVVEMGDSPQVLIKNVQNGQSRYFAKGEDAYGFTVDEIRADSVVLARDGRTHTVRMSSDVTIEGPGSSSAAAPSLAAGRGGFGGRAGFGGFGGDGRGRGGFGGFGGGDGGRSRRGGETGGRGRGGNGGGEGGFSTSEIFALPTWSERLKKLDEMKAQIEPERYERLRAFMAERAKREQQN